MASIATTGGVSGLLLLFPVFALLASLADGLSPEFEVVGSALTSGSWPRPWGCELAAGAWPVTGRMAVLAGAGTEIPARIERWTARDDGSPLLVRVLLGDRLAGARRLRLAPVHWPSAACPLHVEERAGVVAVTASAELAQWRATRGRIELQAADTHLALAFDRCALAVDGEAREPRPPAPFRRIGPDGAGLELATELQFAASTESADSESALRESVACRCVVASSGRQAELELELTAGRDGVVRRWTLPGELTGVDARLLRGADEVVAAKGGSRQTGALLPVESCVEEGHPTAPLELRAGRGRGTIELVWSDFGSARPAAARLDQGGQFRLDLVAAPVALRSGQTLRRRLLVRTGELAGTAVERPWVVPRGSDARAALLTPDEASWLTSWRDFLATWQARPRELLEVGASPTAWGACANGEYDLGGSCLWLGMHERDAAWLAAGSRFTQHVLAFDRAREAVGPWPAGLLFQHGDDHASGKIELGHQWTDGFLGLARAEGSFAALEAARELVAALQQLRGTAQRFAGPERRLAWPLDIAVAQAHAQEPGSAAELARDFVARLAARQDRSGFLDGDRKSERDGVRTWVNSWVSLGITVPALARAHELAPDARAVAIALARFIAREAVRDDGLAEVLLVDPAIATVVERRGVCRKGDAAFAAAGLEWLAAETGDAVAGDLATRLWSRARADLAVPRAEEIADLSKALRALRVRELLAGAAPGQSLSSPSRRRPLRFPE